MAKTLVMTFINEQSQKVNISVDDPREDVTEAEIKTVMNDIVAKNIFTSKGGNLVKLDGAKIVTTSVTEFEYNN